VGHVSGNVKLPEADKYKKQLLQENICLLLRRIKM
jgi:hypothetical protein